MPKRTCSVDQCDRPAKSRGWCQTHYMYWYTNRVAPKHPIRTWGRARTEICQVEGCNQPYECRGYCASHYKRIQTHGEPGSPEIRPRVIPDDDATYELVHLRLKKRRGPASTFRCVTCDGPAQQWAYDHQDLNEKHSDKGYAFSVNPDHYQPMCVPCHKRFDTNHRDAAKQQHYSDN